MGAIATEEPCAEGGQDGGRLLDALACGPLLRADLGGGDLVEEAGSPCVEVAVPRQVVGLATFLHHRELHTQRLIEAAGFPGATVTGILGGSKILHNFPSAHKGKTAPRIAKATARRTSIP